MRYILLCIWCTFPLSVVKAQLSDAEYVYQSAKHSTVSTYSPDEIYEHLVLASNFSKETVQQIPFTDRRIIRIDLVYTTFRESDQFDQRQLDLARLQALIGINPRIVENQFFEWNIIGQTGCGSSSQCGKFFHGFVIYYEDYFTKETTRQEIDSIQSELRELNRLIVKNQESLQINYDRIDCLYPESNYSSEYLTDRLDKLYRCNEDYKGRVFFEADMDYKGRPTNVLVKGSLFPCPNDLAKRLQYVLQWNRGIVIGRKQYGVKAKGYVSFPLRGESVNITGFEIPENLIKEYQMLQQYSQCVAYDMDTSFAELIPKVEKRVVAKTLQRNQWNPELYVVDVTASMYPFTADLLKWLKLKNDSIPKHYVFFNDGNDKPTNQKVIGQTGGLYYAYTSSFEEVRTEMFEAMRNGGGGDLPENNFEALMAGMNQARPTGEIVMIADNYSFPRDEAMLARFTGNLRIILCHTDKGINTDYLTLARKYGFTLHTLDTDIEDLSKTRISIENINYQFQDGKYYRMR
ncbi:hypothetical protein [Marinoscillum sp.]|uniref:hypothetical protein n=1 Tax=Marinoscillum sp. TaxID=2024838 RepID=UPI003BA9BD40